MKKRLILKVLGLLLLLPMFSGCNDTDDVAASSPVRHGN